MGESRVRVSEEWEVGWDLPEQHFWHCTIMRSYLDSSTLPVSTYRMWQRFSSRDAARAALVALIDGATGTLADLDAFGSDG